MLPAARVEVLDVQGCALGEVDERSLCGDGDRVAGVACNLRGAMFGTALFAMEPEDAFAWVLSSGTGGDPLASYVSGVSEILEALTTATARTLGVTSLGEAVLREESLMEILIGTHAPSDTLLLSARLKIHAEGMSLPAGFYLLVSPKYQGQLSVALLD